MTKWVTIFIISLLVINKANCQKLNSKEFKTNFIYQDTLVTSIDSTIYGIHKGYLRTLKKPDQFLIRDSQLLQPVKPEVCLYHSIKDYDQFVALTIIVPGKYQPQLYLLTFNESGRLINELLLERNFVDAGEVDIYSCKNISDYFVRSYVTQIEKFIDKQGYTIVDSTALSFTLSQKGKIDTLDNQNFKREIKWKN